MTRPDAFELVPKKRYRIMWPHMERVGTLGQRMMTQTATVQVNVDYGSEADAMQKLRVGMGISSLLTAMFANSPLSDGDLPHSTGDLCADSGPGSRIGAAAVVPIDQGANLA